MSAGLRAPGANTAIMDALAFTRSHLDQAGLPVLNNSTRLLRAAAFAATLSATSLALPAQCGFDPNFGGSLALSDDSVTPGLPLGFPFVFAGVTYDSVIVSSNGFIYLWDSLGTIPLPTLDRCCSGSVAGLLSSASPIVAGMWQDLNPSAGGSVHFNALAGKALITFSGVPEYSNLGSNTFQITLNASGAIEMVFDLNCALVTHVGLTGMSPGANAVDPGGSDLSATPFPTTSATVYQVFPATTFDLQGNGMQFIPTGSAGWLVIALTGCAGSSTYGSGCPAGTPLSLNAQAGSRPVIGQNFTIEASRVRAGSVSAAVNFGFLNPALNLGAIGLPACTLLSSVDVSIGVTPVAPVTTLTFGIPNFPSIIGAMLNAQAVMIDPSLGGSLPAYLSDGLQMTFGN